MRKLEAFLKLFGHITILEVVEFIIAVAFFVIVLVQFIKFVNKKHDIEQQRNEDIQEALAGARSVPTCQERNKLVHKELKDEITTVYDNLENKILNLEQKVDTKIDGLQDTLDGIMKHLCEIDEERKKRECSRIRDLLIQSYNLYANPTKNETMAWSEMECANFTELYNDYVALGGNSYIQSHVKPAMDELRVIKMTDIDALYKMMHSRKP